MLRTIRERSTGIIGKTILGLLIVSFAVWGIGDMLVTHPGQEIVAKVGKTTISRSMLEREMQKDVAQLRQRLGEEYRAEILGMLNIPQQVAGRMVMQELQKQETIELGILPSNEEVAKVLRDDRMFQNEDGRFDKKRFEYILRQNGLSERDFVAIMRDDIARRLLSQIISGTYPVSDLTVQVLQAAEQESRSISLYSIQKPELSIEEPTDEELETYYQKVSRAYLIPEYRKINYVTFSSADVKNRVKVTNEELKALYEERAGEYNMPERRDVTLLLYTGQEDASKAADLLKSGVKTSEVVKQVPPMNPNKTSMEGITKAQLTEELQEPAFSLSQGAVSEPIASGFGYHVLRVDGVTAPSTKSFAEVEQSLRNELNSIRMGDEMIAFGDELQDALAGGQSLSEVAKEFNLNVSSVDFFSKQGKAPSGGKVSVPELKNFVQISFNTEKGHSSAVSVGKPDTYYIVEVADVKEEQLPPLDQKKNELKKQWLEEQKSKQQQVYANEVAAKLSDEQSRAEGLTMAGVKELRSGSLNRNDSKLGSVELPIPMLQSIFSADIGSVTEVYQLNNGSYVVAMVESSKLPELKKDMEAEALQTARTSIQSNQQQELMQQYMEHLYKKYNVEIYQDVLQQIGKEAR